MEAGVNEKLASDELVVGLLRECLHRHSSVYNSMLHNLKHPSLTKEGKKNIEDSMKFHEDRLLATCEVYRRLGLTLRWRDVMLLPSVLREKARQQGVEGAQPAALSDSA